MVYNKFSLYLRNARKSSQICLRTRSLLTVLYCRTQSRQSAKLFLQSSELELQHLLSRRRVAPPPHPTLLSGGEGTTVAGEGLGESQFRRGDIQYTVVLYIYV
jgi:hypothetical protein